MVKNQVKYTQTCVNPGCNVYIQMVTEINLFSIRAAFYA